MSTVDLTVGGGVGMPAHRYNRLFVLLATLDCAVNGLANNDVAKMLNVPAKTLVLGVQYDVETVEGAADTFDVGDGDDADGYHDGVSANALASGYSAIALAEGAPNTLVGYGAGKYYAAADTIDLTAKAALAATKITLRAVCVDLSS